MRAGELSPQKVMQCGCRAFIREAIMLELIIVLILFFFVLWIFIKILQDLLKT
jgi:hypothetical protein